MQGLQDHDFAMDYREDYDVAEGYERLRSWLPSSAVVLLAALDSDHHPAETTTGIGLLAGGACEATAGGGLVFSHVEFGERLDQGLLNGFDEIWIFRERPDDLENCPVSIATDRLDRAEIQTELPTWLSRFQPLIGLGDGIGLRQIRHASLTSWDDSRPAG